MITQDKFFWWIGIVEDRADPEFLGRYRVRILGYHTGNRDVLPTEDLPWAVCMLPVTSPGVSGVGSGPKLVEGSTVIGFFADGNDMQQPIIMGSFMKNPQVDSSLSDPDTTDTDAPANVTDEDIAKIEADIAEIERQLAELG